MKKNTILWLSFLIIAFLALCLLTPNKVSAEGIKFTVTGYSSLDSCNTKLCLMASGKSAYVGAVACPRKIPLGSKVRINNKVYTCEDRTAKRFDGRYDIFFGYGKEAHAKAINWGIRKVDVYIVSMVK